MGLGKAALITALFLTGAGNAQACEWRASWVFNPFDSGSPYANVTNEGRTISCSVQFPPVRTTTRNGTDFKYSCKEVGGNTIFSLYAHKEFNGGYHRTGCSVQPLNEGY